MTLHRATLTGLTFLLAMGAGAFAETVNDTSTATMTTPSTPKTMTMQQLQGRNLLWLSATLTVCPAGTTQVNVKTETGTKKACVDESTTSSSTMQSTTPPAQ